MNRSLSTKIADLVADNVTNPTIAFASANWTAVAGTPDASIVDHSVAALAVVLTVSGTSKDSWQERPISTPFFALSAVNYSLAAMLLSKSAQNGFEDKSTLILAIALAGWATGHLFNGLQIKKEKKPKGILDNANTHYGYSDLAAIHVSPPPGGINFAAGAFAVLGLARTFLENATPAALKKHVSATRLYAMSYTAGAIGTALSLPAALPAMANAPEQGMHMHMIGMQLQAAWAYVNFDVGVSRMLKNTFRHFTGKPLLEKPKTFEEPSPQPA